MIIWAVIQFVCLILFVPETYHPVLLRRKAQKLRKETGDERWNAPIEKMDKSILKTVLWSCIRPFQLLFFEPMVRHFKTPSRMIYRLASPASYWDVTEVRAHYLRPFEILERCHAEVAGLTS